MACALVEAITGEDLVGRFRECIRARDLRAICETVARERGIETIRPQLARRGDVVLYDRPRDALAVVDLSGRFAVAPGQRGVRRLPLEAAVAAWRI